MIKRFLLVICVGSLSSLYAMKPASPSSKGKDEYVAYKDDLAKRIKTMDSMDAEARKALLEELREAVDQASITRRKAELGQLRAQALQLHQKKIAEEKKALEAEAAENAKKAAAASAALAAISKARNHFLKGKNGVNLEKFGEILQLHWDKTDLSLEGLFTHLREEVVEDRQNEFDQLRPAFEACGMAKLPAVETEEARKKREESEAYKAIKDASDAYVTAKDLTVASDALIKFGDILRQNWNKTGKDIAAIHTLLRSEVAIADQARFDGLRPVFEANGLAKLSNPADKNNNNNNRTTKTDISLKKSNLVWWIQRAVPAVLVAGGVLAYVLYHHKYQPKNKAGAKTAPAR